MSTFLVATAFMSTALISVHAFGDASLRGGNGAAGTSGVVKGPHVARRLDEADPMGGSFEHLGCFKDSKAERVLGHMLTSPEMTPMMCHTHCDGIGGAAYMATQYGVECWCARDGLLDYEREGVGLCDIYCGGDSEETCGGHEAFELYEMEWAPASDDMDYVGCYSDVKGERVMDDMTMQDDMTPAVCRELCVEKKSTFYGTQFGNECWCGTSSSVSDYTVNGEGVCHVACAGDETVACGGYNSFSLFMVEEPYAPSMEPMAEATAVPVEQDEEGSIAVTSGEGSGEAGEYTELLDIHNKDRCMHNAAPLAWDDTIHLFAKEYAATLTNDQNCGLKLVHRAKGTSPYGENLYGCWSTGDAPCYSAEGAMKGLYNNELEDSVEEYGGHATAILWKSTEKIGCAVDTCVTGDRTHYALVCNFDPPGNNMANLEEEVELPSKSAAQCGL